MRYSKNERIAMAYPQLSLSLSFLIKKREEDEVHRLNDYGSLVSRREKPILRIKI